MWPSIQNKKSLPTRANNMSHKTMEIAEITFRQTYCVQMVRASFQFLHSPDYSSFLFFGRWTKWKFISELNRSRKTSRPYAGKFFPDVLFSNWNCWFCFFSFEKIHKGISENTAWDVALLSSGCGPETFPHYKHWFCRTYSISTRVLNNIDGSARLQSTDECLAKLVLVMGSNTPHSTTLQATSSIKEL